MGSRFKVAIAHITPITFDIHACVSKICEYVDVAADGTAQMVVLARPALADIPAGDRQ